MKFFLFFSSLGKPAPFAEIYDTTFDIGFRPYSIVLRVIDPVNVEEFLVLKQNLHYLHCLLFGNLFIPSLKIFILCSSVSIVLLVLIKEGHYDRLGFFDNFSSWFVRNLNLYIINSIFGFYLLTFI